MKNMKTALSAISLLLCLGATPMLSMPAAREDSLIDKLAWMRGRWVIQDEGQYIEETWGPAREDGYEMSPLKFRATNQV